MKVRAALEERNAKTRDNKQAHFVLGFDSATAASEHVRERDANNRYTNMFT